MRPLTGEELDRLFQEVKSTYLYIPTCIAVATGLRLGEVLGLRWEDIDLKRGIITVKRTQKVRRVKEEHGTKYENYGPPKSKNCRRSVDILPGMLPSGRKAHKKREPWLLLPGCGKEGRAEDFFPRLAPLLRFLAGSHG
ncbi:MAG: tyrosine-type recombinase/integrase [Clostridia bacterium]|nr:tyrosine-type recombinase/integrase [Clostridia bacterium]